MSGRNATKEELDRAHDAAVRDKESGGKKVLPHSTHLSSNDLNSKEQVNSEYNRAYDSANVKKK